MAFRIGADNGVSSDTEWIWQARRGMVVSGELRCGTAWQGKAGEDSSGAARCGQFRNGMAGKAGLVTVCPDAERCGRRGKVSSGLVRSGKVWQASYG